MIRESFKLRGITYCSNKSISYLQNSRGARFDLHVWSNLKNIDDSKNFFQGHSLARIKC